MDTDLVVAIVGAITSIGAVIIANRFTSRSARRAQKRTAEIEVTKVDAAAYGRARESYEAALSTHQKRIEQLTAEAVEDRLEYREKIAECDGRIRELEDARRVDQLRIRTLVMYMRRLIDILRENRIDYPMPPPEFDQV